MSTIPSDAESLDRIVEEEDRVALPSNANISSPGSSMDCIHKRFVKEKTPQLLTSEWLLWEDDRIVLLRGEIDDRVANLAVAMLLYLNHVAAHEPIHLYIDSSGGSVTGGFAILDTMDHIVAPVYTHCIGEAHGMAGLILAHGSRGNRFGCMDIRCTFVPVTAGKATSKSQAHLDKTSQIVIQKLALDTGQNKDTIAEDMESWLTLDAGQAVVYGLIDVVVE